MKRLLFLPLVILLCLSAQAAQNSRSDTFTVKHYEIDLDISNVSSHNISGHCTLQVQSKINLLSVLRLDLLKLTIDSIMFGTNSLVYQYNDTLVQVMLPYNLNAGDTATLTVYYHGHPVTDATWGGFYFSGNYAYNMGVGFSADPHNYGRVWFPCIDNFVDKAFYDFYITTASANRAMCNGLLLGQTTDVNGNITWHWQTKHPLPTYLASVAVCNYMPIQYTYHGISDTFPIVLSPPPSDTNDIRGSFINLNDILAGYEHAFGPQPFAKVGFTEVPFSGGAMEHAGNISYPVFAVDGTTNYEDLYAHELSHHWFGDMVTCETAEDMWLNEGWASYCAIYTDEVLYGKEAYKKAERANHLDVLQYAYVKDGGYRAIYGIPHDYTYGEHVYKKGADVAHTLRSYLGDSTFFSSLRYHLQQHAYANSNSYQFRDDLTAASGMDMTPFFNDWVFNPGFPHFSIDSFATSQNGGAYQVTVYIKQKLKHAPSYYTNVPLEVTYMDNLGHQATHTVTMSGHCGIYTSQLAFAPTYVGLDLEEKISDATTDKYLYIDSVGTYDFEEALMTLNVTSVTDSAFVRVVHNWVYPDPPKTVIPGLHISQERYWLVDGVWPQGFNANATIIYNGTASTSGGYLDNQLITNNEDSLVVLYRASPATDWAIDSNNTLMVQGSTTNKKGYFIINQIKKGEYTLAIWDHSRADSNVVLDNSACTLLGINSPKTTAETQLSIVPNPASDSFRVQLPNPATTTGDLLVYDITGRELKHLQMQAGEQQKVISANGLGKGTYLVVWQSKTAKLTGHLVIVK